MTTRCLQIAPTTRAERVGGFFFYESFSSRCRTFFPPFRRSHTHSLSFRMSLRLCAALLSLQFEAAEGLCPRCWLEACSLKQGERRCFLISSRPFGMLLAYRCETSVRGQCYGPRAAITTSGIHLVVLAIFNKPTMQATTIDYSDSWTLQQPIKLAPSKPCRRSYVTPRCRGGMVIMHVRERIGIWTCPSIPDAGKCGLRIE